ncbi:hypothetical protein CH63R_11737 [Colletotrichum higginsianum IMI 349063]|uniref:Uncharacterized protein n=1 Tax=Colletotrichum higginsianum (strain IMI 349063) TaxID=759273 RepID=A0A1B7XZ64_COLHI|nr:hypothetical protein CH63R_11737 [Colletotrichum higginsianum IMI 349063]OBR05034.1 hypothetical protein CH63R_11737 [Colletotrichum higginsianum IMI 349063]
MGSTPPSVNWPSVPWARAQTQGLAARAYVRRRVRTEWATKGRAAQKLGGTAFSWPVQVVNQVASSTCYWNRNGDGGISGILSLDYYRAFWYVSYRESSVGMESHPVVPHSTAPRPLSRLWDNTTCILFSHRNAASCVRYTM